MMFQTFLVGKDNKVVAIGNPIHNPKAKDLYLSIISGKKDIKKTDTPQIMIGISEVDSVVVVNSHRYESFSELLLYDVESLAQDEDHGQIDPTLEPYFEIICT